MEEHAHLNHALSSSTLVAAPSDVAHLLREGSGMMHSPSAENFRLDGRAEVYFDTSPSDSLPAPDSDAPTAEAQ